GSDKPDVRFGLELHDVTEIAAGSGFKIFDDAASGGGRVVALAAPGMGDASRSQIDGLTDLAKRSGAKGLVHLSIASTGSVTSPIGRHLGEGRAEAIAAA